jgi:DeoR/GlpR family transcriptional regulator of sugar metabolism
MARTEREEKILAILQESPSVSVKSLTKSLYVSEATIRRDLVRLEQEGLIIRTHGKAVSTGIYADKNQGFNLRENTASPIKKRLAERAVSLCVTDGAVVFLDASSTAMHTVDFLSSRKDVIVITSGLKTAVMLSNTNVKFYSTGGKAINSSMSLVGQTAIDTVNNFNADVCFVSCHGVSESGFATDTSERENDLRKAMLSKAKRKVLLIDSTKIDSGCWHNLCHLSLFDDVFCDKPLPQNVLNSIKNFHLV